MFSPLLYQLSYLAKRRILPDRRCRPKPASLLIDKKGEHFLQRRVRRFLGEEMSAWKRSSRDIVSKAPPVLEWFELPMNHPSFAPEHEHGTTNAGVAVGDVMIEIDARCRAVILAGRVNGRRVGETAFVLGERARIEMLQSGRPAAELATKVIRWIGADQAFGKIERLDQEEPVVIRRRKSLVGVRKHQPRRRNIENDQSPHLFRVV